MSFAAPQVLLLLLPLGLFLYFTARIAGPPMWVRATLVIFLTVALARPEMAMRSAGSDVLVVVDRSRSMPLGGEALAAELIHLLETQRRHGDRLGVLSFGRSPRTEMQLSTDGRFSGFTAAIDGDASNLSAALDAAGTLIPHDRNGRVLVLSDGHATGLDAKAAARRLASRGIPVDVRFLGREEQALDVAVSTLQVPSAVASHEPFLLTATVKATEEATATLTLLRNKRPLVKTERALSRGANVLTFRDLLESPGLATYELLAEVAGDSVPENDVGRAVLRVEGPVRVLLLTDKPQGTLAKTLLEANVNLEVRSPGPLSMDQLENVGAVVLEDVEASRLSENGLRVVAQFVRQAGGGLVMTGGKHSFGEGGYRKSPIETLLPVSLEVREEQRKSAIAMDIIMDCSCSMGVTVPDGRTKMQLAAEGVVGALQLLNPRDEASVHLVDTEDHEIFSMSSVGDGLPLDKVARAYSGGGGIYVGKGLRTAKKQILSSNKETRHVLLFSDAADSEEPDDYEKTVAELVSRKVTVSVIGMGSRADSDAKLLEDIARRGNGRIYFAEDVTSLPRIFSQETIAVARSTFVEEGTATKLGADWAQLGKTSATDGPGVGGYNLTYLKPLASVALRTLDANEAPILSMWPHGAGRVAALTAEVDGPFTGPLRQWSGQRAMLTQLVRWTMPSAKQHEAVVRTELLGDELHVTLEFERDATPPAGAPTLVLLSGDAKSNPVELPMRWEDEDRLGVHWVVPGTGTWHPVVQVGAQTYRAPPVTLPWAPEFEPVKASEGRAFLASVAKAGSGLERLAMVGLFQEAVQSEATLSLAPVLLAVGVGLLLLEVLLRRLLSGPRLRRRARREVPEAVQPSQAIATTKETATVQDALGLAKERARNRTSH